MTRALIFTTHPIQYQIPWFNALSATSGLDVEVVFSYVPSAKEQGIGFGKSFQWDIPLLTGYKHRVLDSKRLPAPLPSFIRRWSFGILAALNDFRPDVAVILGWQEIYLVQALLACRRRGIPIILRGESNTLKTRSSIVSAVHSQYFRLCNAFLSIGQANSALYESAGVPRSKIVTANYFVDNDWFQSEADGLRSERQSLRRDWFIPESATCFAFVGKIEPKKCVMDYLTALSLARQQGAAVCGLVVGSGVLLKEAQNFVDAHALPVTFAGFLNQSEITKAYVAADALVLPSDYGETWGLVVNEAMATGLPAIVSDRVGCANDLVLDGVTGRVVPHGDQAALASAMRQLADQGIAKPLGIAARSRVLSEYSISRAVARTQEAISLALSPKLAAA